MPRAERIAALSRRVEHIVNSDGFALEHLAESLDSAVRRGAFISPTTKELALETTARIIDGQALSPDHAAVLEGIVLGNGLRPAFDIEQDTFDTLPSTWSQLNDARLDLTSVIRSIGRLNVAGHPKVSFAGTSFVCGENLLMTNRHVVEEFMTAQASGLRLEFKPGMSATVDLKEEVGSAAATLLEATGEALFSDEWDVAVFRVRSLPAGLQPVRFAGAKFDALAERTVAVVGYPAFDESEDLMEQIKIFHGVFNKKRLQPGKAKGLKGVFSYGRTVEALAHDCSTLGGNSGAALIDVSTRTVMGVHFGGDSGIANYCVPSWALRELAAFAGVRQEFAFL